MKNKNANAGSVEIITFRATRTEHPYLESILGLFRGTSTGHIALKILFDDTALFNKYINKNKNIQYKIITDPQTDAEQYEVYVSFWPQVGWSPQQNCSTLQSYQFDCENSAGYCAVEYNPRFSRYLNPIQRFTQSALPLIKDITTSKITAPPTVILHTSRLANAYAEHIANFFDTPNPDQMPITAAAVKYTQKYHAWRVAIVAEQNAKILYLNDAKDISQFKHNTILAHARLKASQKKLKYLLVPNRLINDQEFYDTINPFITLGYPERDSVKLPLINKHQNKPGIELEPMLAYINKIANNPEQFPYNVFTTNCAKIVFDILWRGVENSKFNMFKRDFVLPWFIRWFKLTITPTVMIIMLSKIQQSLESLERKSKNISKVEIDLLQDEIVDPAECSTIFRKKHFKDHCLEQPSQTLEFSDHKSKDDSDSEDRPTTRITIFAKMLENMSQYIR